MSPRIRGSINTKSVNTEENFTHLMLYIYIFTLIPFVEYMSIESNDKTFLFLMFR